MNLDKEWFTKPEEGRFQVIVDEKMTEKMLLYITNLGLKLNPFKHQMNLLELEEKCDVCASIYALFVDAYLKTKAYWYMRKKDLYEAFRERGIPIEWIEIGLREGVLEKVIYANEEWIGLRKDLAPW